MTFKEREWFIYFAVRATERIPFISEYRQGHALVLNSFTKFPSIDLALWMKRPTLNSNHLYFYFDKTLKHQKDASKSLMITAKAQMRTILEPTLFPCFDRTWKRCDMTHENLKIVFHLLVYPTKPFLFFDFPVLSFVDQSDSKTSAYNRTRYSFWPQFERYNIIEHEKLMMWDMSCYNTGGLSCVWTRWDRLLLNIPCITITQFTCLSYVTQHVHVHTVWFYWHNEMLNMIRW